MTETLERRTVGEELAARLRRKIFVGELPPDRALPEAALAEEYAVSRPSVRDALRRLAHEGLVRHETHRGARVASLSDDELRDVLLVRTILEPEVVRRFGLPEELGSRLSACVGQLEASAAAQDWPAYGEADINFHETLVAAARSSRLSETHSRAMRQLRLHFVSVDQREQRPATDRRHVGEHRRIADLLAADEREAAAGLLLKHLEDARAAVARKPRSRGNPRVTASYNG